MRRGFVAAALFIIWFLIVDVVKQQPLFTLAYLSGLLFSFTTALPATARVIVLVLVLVIVFVLAALIAARFKRTILSGIVIAVALFGFFFGVGALVFRVNILHTLGWIELLLGCLLAGVGIVGPSFRHRNEGVS